MIIAIIRLVKRRISRRMAGEPVGIQRVFEAIKTIVNQGSESHKHLFIPESATRGHRVIIIGDIHGCHEELVSLLDKCSYRPGIDIAISVGDLVNKGPGSAKVLEIVQKLQILSICGNHDLEALHAYKEYKKSGTIPQKQKYAWVTSADLTPQGAALLESLPYSISLESYGGIVVVHAGMVPGVGILDQNPDNLVKMRDVVPASVVTKGTSPGDTEADDESEAEIAAESTNEMHNSGAIAFDWDACIKNQSGYKELVASERKHPGGRSWASVYRGKQHVFFGHDATRRLQLEPDATGIDGGCVYGGCLYALVLAAVNEQGRPLEGQEMGGLHTSDIEKEIRLHSGAGPTAYLVSVPATKVHCAPKKKT